MLRAVIAIFYVTVVFEAANGWFLGQAFQRGDGPIVATHVLIGLTWAWVYVGAYHGHQGRRLTREVIQLNAELLQLNQELIERKIRPGK